VSLNVRLKDLLGPVTRVKKTKKKMQVGCLTWRVVSAQPQPCAWKVVVRTGSWMGPPQGKLTLRRAHPGPSPHNCPGLRSCLSARWSTRIWLARNFDCNVTTFAPHKALELIVWGRLTFDERVVLHRVAGNRSASLTQVNVLWKPHNLSLDTHSDATVTREDSLSLSLSGSPDNTCGAGDLRGDPDVWEHEGG